MPGAFAVPSFGDEFQLVHFMEQMLDLAGDREALTH